MQPSIVEDFPTGYFQRKCKLNICCSINQMWWLDKGHPHPKLMLWYRSMGSFVCPFVNLFFFLVQWSYDSYKCWAYICMLNPVCKHVEEHVYMYVYTFIYKYACMHVYKCTFIIKLNATYEAYDCYPRFPISYKVLNTCLNRGLYTHLEKEYKSLNAI